MNFYKIYSILTLRLRIFYEILTDVNFTKVIPVKDLGLDPKKVFQCSPSTIKYLYIVLNYLKINKNKKILDIGCGKGSVIKFFKEQGCKKVDGLEISKKLTMIARNNFLKININTKIYNINAINFKFYGKYDIFYLYNPFPKNIAQLVFSNIKSQIKIFNKKFYVIYVNPTCSYILIKNGFVLKKKFDYIGGTKINVYSYN